MNSTYLKLLFAIDHAGQYNPNTRTLTCKSLTISCDKTPENRAAYQLAKQIDKTELCPEAIESLRDYLDDQVFVSTPVTLNGLSKIEFQSFGMRTKEVLDIPTTYNETNVKVGEMIREGYHITEIMQEYFTVQCPSGIERTLYYDGYGLLCDCRDRSSCNHRKLVHYYEANRVEFCKAKVATLKQRRSFKT